MSDAFYTFITALLPLSYAVRRTEVTVEQEYVVLQLTATMPTAYGPCCGVPSSSVHRHDQRRLTDLPWGRRGAYPAHGTEICVPPSHLRTPSYVESPDDEGASGAANSASSCCRSFFSIVSLRLRCSRN
jgi:hypothetical protein